MNSKIETNKNRNKMPHTTGFSNVHPPGGFVAWPDGTTSRIGEKRKSHQLLNSQPVRKGFFSWPENAPQLIRA